jgi:hypothetical protein
MKYFIVLLTNNTQPSAQEIVPSQKVSGFIYNDNTKSVLIMQISSIIRLEGARTDANGYFEIDVQPTRYLHISLLGFQSELR